MKQDPMLDFVKGKLEQGEGISADALTKLLVVASKRQATTRRIPFLLAASLAVMACGWFFHADAINTRRESNLADAIKLLRLVDGEADSESASITDNLLSWQDAPMADVISP